MRGSQPRSGILLGRHVQLVGRMGSVEPVHGQMRLWNADPNAPVRRRQLVRRRQIAKSDLRQDLYDSDSETEDNEEADDGGGSGDFDERIRNAEWKL